MQAGFGQREDFRRNFERTIGRFGEPDWIQPVLLLLAAHLAHQKQPEFLLLEELLELGLGRPNGVACRRRNGVESFDTLGDETCCDVPSFEHLSTFGCIRKLLRLHLPRLKLALFRRRADDEHRRNGDIGSARDALLELLDSLSELGLGHERDILDVDGARVDGLGALVDGLEACLHAVELFFDLATVALRMKERMPERTRDTELAASDRITLQQLLHQIARCDVGDVVELACRRLVPIRNKRHCRAGLEIVVTRRGREGLPHTEQVEQAADGPQTERRRRHDEIVRQQTDV